MNYEMKRFEGLERVLWSIALPGLGQILNKQFLKGVLFITLEFLINVKSNINTAIILSFQGDIDGAIRQTGYEWIMFYPCVYIFAIYDAYINMKAEKPPLAFLPFVSSAIAGTIGMIYSSRLKPFGILLGPIWSTIVFFLLGAFTGYIMKCFVFKIMSGYN